MKLKRHTVPDEIPTASTADIAFLLVVFFMLTLTFAISQGLDMTLPPEEEKVVEVDPVESVLVEIQRDASLQVDGRHMPLDRLLAYLEPKLRDNPRKPVIVHPAPDSPYGAMVSVYDELRRGKMELGLAREIQIALPTQREVDQHWQ
ncbi:MAG: biopolymer transporter ExbD [Acidobacteriota bacterium]